MTVTTATSVAALATECKPVRQWLTDMFGESASYIRDIDNPWIGDTVTFRPHLCIRNTNGGLFVSCGGEVLMSFARYDGMRGHVMLVRDSREANEWDWEQTQARDAKQHTPTRSKPDAVLRLVYSA